MSLYYSRRSIPLWKKIVIGGLIGASLLVYRGCSSSTPPINTSRGAAVQVIDNGKRIYKNSDRTKQFDMIEEDIQKEYPGIAIPRLCGYINDGREVDQTEILYRARNRVMSRASKDGVVLPIEFIIAALCNEGHSLDVDKESPSSDSGDFPYNGFGSFGLDDFGKDFE